VASIALTTGQTLPHSMYINQIRMQRKFIQKLNRWLKY